MENQKNQSQQEQQHTPQQAPSRQEGVDQSTQAAGGANGYDPNREQQEVNREQRELNTESEESNDSKNPNPSQTPGRGI
ncbi:MAG: hypothetical protein BGO70_09660 [Bacteroidetes bacterium 43-93]|nr:hypothetical protein [Bacteroidota bacterium]OJX00424.1 MAG: hypothetical protein BGO70_09660 [Bacteroidetes bacterium 43-93]